MPHAPERRRSELGADTGDVLIGLALFAALLVVVALTEDTGTALAILIGVALVFAPLVLVVAIVRRSLRQGFCDAIRWTFGFVGRWL